VVWFDERAQTAIPLGELGERAGEAALFDIAAAAVAVWMVQVRQTAILTAQVVGAEVGFEARAEVEQAVEGAPLFVREGVISPA
jgi:hypothetical protein